MERYLLFDSGCSLCTSIARQVEEDSEGKLVARSLRDHKVKSILDDVSPGWRWEPMLLEVDDGQHRVYTGARMRVEFVRVLGLRQALDVLRVVQNATLFKPQRRGMLKMAGGLLAGLTLGGWASRAVNAGDVPGAESITKLFLPFLQGNQVPSSPQESDAAKALALVLNSTELAAFRVQNEQRGLKVPSQSEQLQPVVLSDGSTLYKAEKQAVFLAGEKEGHRLFQVFLGTGILSGDPLGSNRDVVLMGIVDILTEQVLDVYQIDVSVLGDASGVQLNLQTSSGRVSEYIERNGEAILVNDNQITGSVDWCSWWASVLCATGGGLACLTTCGALCYVTAGLACGACTAICWSVFTGICATAHC